MYSETLCITVVQSKEYYLITHKWDFNFSIILGHISFSTSNTYSRFSKHISWNLILNFSNFSESWFSCSLSNIFLSYFLLQSYQCIDQIQSKQERLPNVILSDIIMWSLFKKIFNNMKVYETWSFKIFINMFFMY